MTTYLSIRNLKKFQHYTKRRPPWIKVHQTILEDLELMALPDATKWLAVGLILLASRSNNRIITDPKPLMNALHLDAEPNLNPLIDIGFLVEPHKVAKSPRASIALADGEHDADTLSTEYRVQSKRTTTTQVVGHIEKPIDPNVETVLAHYVAVHPKRRPGPKVKLVVIRALRSYSVEELTAAIDGNAADAWHREKGKHELDYVLRDNEKIDSFRLKPAVRDWSKEPMTDGEGKFTPAYHEWTAAGCP